MLHSNSNENGTTSNREWQIPLLFLPNPIWGSQTQGGGGHRGVQGSASGRRVWVRAVSTCRRKVLGLAKARWEKSHSKGSSQMPRTASAKYQGICKQGMTVTQSLFSKSLNKSTPSFQSFNHLSSLKFLSLILSSLLCLQEKFHPLKNGNSTTKLMYFVPLAKRYSRPWKISTPNQKQNPHKEQAFSLIPYTHKFLCCSQTYFHFI